MRRSTLSLIGIAFVASAPASAATALNGRGFDTLPVTDSVLASIRGSGLSAQPSRLVEGGIRQELAHIRGTGQELMDNWWSDRDLAPQLLFRN
jgi:hypothetical protein